MAELVESLKSELLEELTSGLLPQGDLVFLFTKSKNWGNLYLIRKGDQSQMCMAEGKKSLILK